MNLHDSLGTYAPFSFSGLCDRPESSIYTQNMLDNSKPAKNTFESLETDTILETFYIFVLYLLLITPKVTRCFESPAQHYNQAVKGSRKLV